MMGRLSARLPAINGVVAIRGARIAIRSRSAKPRDRFIRKQRAFRPGRNDERGLATVSLVG
jgi:hypothetical protein